MNINMIPREREITRLHLVDIINTILFGLIPLSNKYKPDPKRARDNKLHLVDIINIILFSLIPLSNEYKHDPNTVKIANFI